MGNGLAARYGRFVRRPLIAYASLELWIGAVGLALVVLLPEMTPMVARVLRPLGGDPALLRLARFTLAFVMQLGPAIAMGATLPLLVRTLFGADDDFGRILGRLYGINTLGAVAGAVASELVFIPHVGVLRSGALAAGMNAVAAVLAMGVARRHAAPGVRRSGGGADRPALGSAALRLLVAAFLSGGAILALEVVWFRLIVLFVAQTSTVFAWMLGVVLAGIGLGGLLASLALRLLPRVHASAGALALVAGAATVFAYRAFPAAAVRFADPNTEAVGSILPLALALMLPTSLLSGVLFTWLGKLIHAELGSDVRATGMLSLANTLGCALGPLLASFVLLPRIGVETSLLLLAASYGAVAACAISRAALRDRSSRLAHAAAGLLFALAIASFPTGLMKGLYDWFLARSVGAREELVAFREGVIATIGYTCASYLGEPYYYRLLTDGYSMSGTPLASQRYMSLFAHIPMALHADPRDALLISYGVGITARALTAAPELTRIDVVDISRDILEMGSIIWKGADDPLTDPRVQVHVEDGRYFLQATEQRYDIATGEPPPPAAAGVVNLYTVEYFGLLRSRLRAGGIASYWLPVEQLAIEDSKEIVAAFCAVFDDCTLWEGSPADWILVGSRGTGHIGEAALRRPWNSARREQLAAIGLERPEQMAALFLADAEFLKGWSSDVAPLEDDWPHRAPRWRSGSWSRGMPAEYAEIANDFAAREAFRRSRFVEAVWPEAFRERSLAEFRTQQLVRATLLDGNRFRIHDLHRILTATDLATLAVWLLGSDADKQRIAASLDARGRDGAAVDYELGIGALARRDYARAARHFDRAQAHDPRAPLYGIYALAMSGDVEGAGARARLLPPSGDPDRTSFLRFLRAELGIEVGSGESIDSFSLHAPKRAHTGVRRSR
jgi:spermidine synthase